MATSGTIDCSSAVKERPILFSGEMVNAILDDRKTQTRRSIERMTGFRCKQFGRSDTKGYDWHFRCQRGMWQDMDHGEVVSRCPYGQVGDRLWVRETWRVHGVYHDKPTRWVTSHRLDVELDLAYAADEYEGEHKGEYRPSIFMPRWASRITLEITDVRIERLREISEVDAKAEGVTDYAFVGSVNAFEALWESINGTESLESNPWVWVVEFRVI
jgi:hypothetical protein